MSPPPPSPKHSYGLELRKDAEQLHIIQLPCFSGPVELTHIKYIHLYYIVTIQPFAAQLSSCVGTCTVGVNIFLFQYS